MNNSIVSIVTRCDRNRTKLNNEDKSKSKTLDVYIYTLHGLNLARYPLTTISQHLFFKWSKMTSLPEPKREHSFVYSHKCEESPSEGQWLPPR